MALSNHTLVAEGENFVQTFKAFAPQHAVQVFTTGTVKIQYSVDGQNFVEIESSESEVSITDIFVLSGIVIGMTIKIISTAAGSISLI